MSASALSPFFSGWHRIWNRRRHEPHQLRHKYASGRLKEIWRDGGPAGNCRRSLVSLLLVGCTPTPCQVDGMRYEFTTIVERDPSLMEVGEHRSELGEWQTRQRPADPRLHAYVHGDFAKSSHLRSPDAASRRRRAPRDRRRRQCAASSGDGAARERSRVSQRAANRQQQRQSTLDPE
jgi:hypothetical protein